MIIAISRAHFHPKNHWVAHPPPPNLIHALDRAPAQNVMIDTMTAYPPTTPPKNWTAANLPSLDGRSFVVTGASGLGFETALALARGGWAVALVTSDPNRQQLAMTLFNWLLAPEHTGPWTQSAGYLPGTASALQWWSVTVTERGR